MEDTNDKHTDEPPAPTVFISYSHDSPEHKMWVAGLATYLRENGVDAILDQWFLRPGMDVPQFMETGIRDANRVCMICTPEYARKADAGKGGVAYEKMIVTGELYQNLGSTKFIPIIARGSDADALPGFLKSKYFVDFRDLSRRQEKLDELLRVLHNIPANQAPPLGLSPFLPKPKSDDDILPKVAAADPVVLTETSEWSPDKVYDASQRLFRGGDSVGWRTLVKELRGAMEPQLYSWLDSLKGKNFTTVDDFVPVAKAAIEIVMPLIALAVSGVESRLPAFADQRTVVDDFLSLSQWPRGGKVVIIDLPKTLVYVYHHVHGAVCLCTQQPELALSMATMNVHADSDSDRPLWQEHGMTGWPKSLDGTFGTAWEYLLQLPETFPWLRKVFVRNDEWQVSLIAYNMILSALDLCLTIRQVKKTGHSFAEVKEKVTFDVPPLFLFGRDEMRARALSLAFLGPSSTALVAQYGGIDPSELRSTWQDWCGLLLRRMNPRFLLPGVSVNDLP